MQDVDGGFAPVDSGLEEASHIHYANVDGGSAPVDSGLEEASCVPQPTCHFLLPQGTWLRSSEKISGSTAAGAAGQVLDRVAG